MLIFNKVYIYRAFVLRPGTIHPGYRKVYLPELLLQPFGNIDKSLSRSTFRR
jgi:hypothetical protein